MCRERITPSTAFSSTHNLEYRFGHSGETVASEIYIEDGVPTEKLIFVTMVVGRSDSKGSSTSSRSGLSDSNSSTTYPAVVPSENVTIRPSSPSFSTFNMCIVLSVMAGRILHCQAADCPLLLTQCNISSMAFQRTKAPRLPTRLSGRPEKVGRGNRAFLGRARQHVRRAHGSRGNMGLRLTLKARTAQNRRATGRLKRNRCGRSTFGTIRLSFGAYPYLGASLAFASLAAFWVVCELFF